MIEILNIHFLQPFYFLLLLLIPVVFFVRYIRRKEGALLGDRINEKLSEISWQKRYSLVLESLFLILILVLFACLMADPHTSDSTKKVSKNGIDIVVALDISKSMDAVDLKPNRIEKAKLTLLDFLDAQETNRLGLVVFAGKPLTSVPLTFDYNILKETLSTVSTDTLQQRASGLDGTAIGDALLMGKTLFERGGEDLVDKQGEEKREKVIILLTDGDANRGVEPAIAAKLLGEEQIRVYSIGIGSKEGGKIIVNQGPFKQEMLIPPLNTTGLKEVASITDGHFFRATDNNSIKRIFEKLEELEKNDIEIEISETFQNHYQIFLYMLMGLLGLYYLFIIFLPKTY